MMQPYYSSTRLPSKQLGLWVVLSGLIEAHILRAGGTLLLCRMACVRAAVIVVHVSALASSFSARVNSSKKPNCR
jgi:hypothetical protein